MHRKCREEIAMREFLRKHGKQISALALMVGMVSTNSICRFFLHQPEVPKKLYEMKENSLAEEKK